MNCRLKRCSSASHPKALPLSVRLVVLLLLAVGLYGCGSSDLALAPAPASAQTVPNQESSNARSFVGRFVDDPGEVSVIVKVDSRGTVTGRGMVFRGPAPAKAYPVVANGTLSNQTLRLRLYPEDRDQETEIVTVSGPLQGGSGFWQDDGRNLRGEFAWQEQTRARLLDFSPEEGTVPEQFFVDMVDANNIGYAFNLTVSEYSAADGFFTGTWSSVGPTAPDSATSGVLYAQSYPTTTNGGGLFFDLRGPNGNVVQISSRLTPSVVGGTADLLTGTSLIVPGGQDLATGLITVTSLGN